MTTRLPLPASRPDSDGKVRPENSTYSELIHVATELFADLGYERTTVREISKRMGLQSGSLYSHISSKDEVLTEIVRRVGNEFIVRAEQALSRSDDPEQNLRDLIAGHIEVIQDYLQAVRVYFDEWTKLDDATRAAIVDVRHEYQRMFEKVLRKGIAAGKFRKVELKSAVVFILSALNWTYKWYHPEGETSPGKLAERYSDLVLSGLRP